MSTESTDVLRWVDRVPASLGPLRKDALVTKAGAFAMRIYEAYR